MIAGLLLVHTKRKTTIAEIENVNYSVAHKRLKLQMVIAGNTKLVVNVSQSCTEPFIYSVYHKFPIREVAKPR